MAINSVPLALFNHSLAVPRAPHFVNRSTTSSCSSNAAYTRGNRRRRSSPQPVAPTGAPTGRGDRSTRVYAALRCWFGLSITVHQDRCCGTDSSSARWTMDYQSFPAATGIYNIGRYNVLLFG